MDEKVARIKSATSILCFSCLLYLLIDQYPDWPIYNYRSLSMIFGMAYYAVFLQKTGMFYHKSKGYVTKEHSPIVYSIEVIGCYVGIVFLLYVNFFTSSG